MSPAVVVAHGVGTRSDLPVDLGLVLTAAALAVLVSFGALGLLWPASRLRGDAAGRPLPRVVQAAVDSPVLRWALRLAVLAVTLLLVAVALVGPEQPPENLAVYAFYVTFWVGLVPASLLLGPVWRCVNPLRTLHRALLPLVGPAPAAHRLPALGLWPAAASLLVYGWLELAYPGRSAPASVGLFLVVYGVSQLIASLWYGEEWFAHGDAFEVYSTLVGRLSPFGRRADGVLVVRNPLDGADGTPRQPGLSAFVMVLVGTTAFDGVTRTQQWQSGPGSAGDSALWPPTLGLLVVVAAVCGLYALATGLSQRITRSPEDGPPAYAHSIIPIAVGYAVAHYFSLLLLDGQLTWILASDPFQTGLDLFGTATNEIDYGAVSVDAIAYTQVGAIVVGHVLGVVLAHDRAVRLAPGERGRTAQYPLLAVMVAFTVGGLYLLLG